jgi:octaprenyl-diphosphate synthase
MATYGMHLGLAFQIADDVLDYTGDADALGKNLGDDLHEGKATLPLIHAMAHADDTLKQRLCAIIEQGDGSAMPDVLAAIEAAGSLQYSIDKAHQHAQAAKAALAVVPDGAWKQALLELADYSVARNH